MAGRRLIFSKQTYAVSECAGHKIQKFVGKQAGDALLCSLACWRSDAQRYIARKVALGLAFGCGQRAGVGKRNRVELQQYY